MHELAVALFVHPTLSGVILLIAATWNSFASDLRIKAEYFGLATVLSILTLISTIASLAPLNSRIAQWNLGAPPANWRDQRDRWDSMHRVRVAVLAAALVSIFLGAIS